MSKAEGVQSVHRALDLLEVVLQHNGQMAIGEIAAVCDIPLPTIHRLLKTLVARGYMRQLPSRHYALGFRLLPLGLSVNALIGADAGSMLSRLVAELGETANLAMLSGDQAEYVAQVPSAFSMRMFTEVGRKVELHCTGVGKALLAQLPRERVTRIIRRLGMPQQTRYTLTTENALQADLDRIQERGYALDDEEQELGVRCVAVPIPGDLLAPMAVSISGPSSRVSDGLIERAGVLLLKVAREFGEEIAENLQNG